jgi:hypothetical protein
MLNLQKGKNKFNYLGLEFCYRSMNYYSKESKNGLIDFSIASSIYSGI